MTRRENRIAALVALAIIALMGVVAASPFLAGLLVEGVR